MCMYGYALNVEEGALALISWQSVPTRAPPTGCLYQRAPIAGGPHQNVSTRAPNRRKKTLPQRAPTKHIELGAPYQKPIIGRTQRSPW